MSNFSQNSPFSKPIDEKVALILSLDLLRFELCDYISIFNDARIAWISFKTKPITSNLGLYWLYFYFKTEIKLVSKCFIGYVLFKLIIFI